MDQFNKLHEVARLMRDERESEHQGTELRKTEISEKKTGKSECKALRPFQRLMTMVATRTSTPATPKKMPPMMARAKAQDR